MRFLVFIKQVPDSADIHFDREKKTIVRTGVKNMINPYDRRAISEAIRYRNENGGEVIVATMGPPQAREALQESLIMGADRAVHLEDTRFAGSDSLATSRVLAAAARKIGFDLIFCGQHSTDSETGQVPPELAELLGIPSVVSVRKIEYATGNVRVTCETDDGIEILELPLPAVLSTAERLIKPIKVKDVALSTAPAEKITTWTLEDLGMAPEAVGLSGSPTWVAGIQEQRVERRPEIIDGSDATIAAQTILQLIRRKSQNVEPPIVPEKTGTSDRQFWCLIEYAEDRVRPVSLEILSTAASLAAAHGGVVSAVLIGAPVGREDLLLLSSYGAGRILQATATLPHPDETVALLCDRISALKPDCVLIPATSSGKLIAPRIAGRLQLGLTGDCIGLEIDHEGKLVQWKPAFGGTIVAPIYSRTFPQMATIRPGALPLFRPRPARKIPVIAWTFPYPISKRFHILSRETDAGKEAAKMNQAEVIVCAGMGLGQDHLPLAFRLSELLGGAAGATRRVVDSGWMPRQYQVGLTGKFVAPRVYLGLGVSGRFNHTIGIQKSGTIIAMNSDANAEIFKVCDLGVTGDCVSIGKAMIKILEG